MKCTQCGAPIMETSSFCNECGARVEQMFEENKEESIKTEEVDSLSLDETVVINIPEELLREAEEKLKRDQALKQAAIQRAARLEKQAELQRLEEVRKSEEQIKQGVSKNIGGQIEKKTTSEQNLHIKHREIKQVPTSLIGLIIMLIKNPLLSIGELELYIDEGRTIKSMLIFILLSSVITAINFNVILGKLIGGLLGLFGDFLLFFGGGQMSSSNSIELAQDILMMPFVQDSGFAIIIYPILSHVILLCMMCLFLIGVFKVIKKEDVSVIDCFRLMLTPLAILLVGKIVVFLLGLISGTIAAYFYVLMMFAVIAVTILHFINFLGQSRFVIYSVPLIYLISAIMRNGIILQLIKQSMAKYAVYF